MRRRGISKGCGLLFDVLWFWNSDETALLDLLNVLTHKLIVICNYFTLLRISGYGQYLLTAHWQIGLGVDILFFKYHTFKYCTNHIVQIHTKLPPWKIVTFRITSMSSLVRCHSELTYYDSETAMKLHYFVHGNFLSILRYCELVANLYLFIWSTYAPLMLRFKGGCSCLSFF